MPKIGDKAPQFCLPNQDDEEICLRDFAGSWIVLYFYPKDNTPGCTAEALDFSAALDEFTKLGAALMGISPDSTVRHRNFIDKKGLKLTLLSDEEKSILRSYGVWRLKKSYGKEFTGTVRSTFIIDPSGKIAEIWDAVRVKGHVQSVLKRLRELIG